MPALAPASPRRDDALDLVAAIGKSPLDPLDEGPEIGIPGLWIHLRDEQDLHRQRLAPDGAAPGPELGRGRAGSAGVALRALGSGIAFGPAGSWPDMKSAAMSEPFLTL